MYEYKAKLVKVHDGDTVTLDIDLGFNQWMRKPCRLFGINAPELKDRPIEAAKARHRLAELLGDNPINCLTQKPLICYSHKDATEKYGRILVTLINGQGVCVNDRMIEEGHASKYG